MLSEAAADREVIPATCGEKGRSVRPDCLTHKPSVDSPDADLNMGRTKLTDSESVTVATTAGGGAAGDGGGSEKARCGGGGGGVED